VLRPFVFSVINVPRETPINIREIKNPAFHGCFLFWVAKLQSAR